MLQIFKITSILNMKYAKVSKVPVDFRSCLGYLHHFFMNEVDFYEVNFWQS